MRCWLAVFILYAVSPLYAGTPASDFSQGQELLWQGRFSEALDYLEPRAREGYYLPTLLCCLIYGMTGSNEEARYYCDRALADARRITAPEVPDIMAMMALADWRAGNVWQAPGLLDRALRWREQPGWLVHMVSIAMRTPEHQQIDAARTLCTQLDETNQPRCRLAFAAIFPEHAKTIRERHAAEDAAAAATHQRRRFLRAGAVIFLVLLAGAATYQYRARITALIAAFLTTRPTPAQPASPPAAPAIPANWQAWQAGYMNRAYQLAAYSWVTVWLLVCLPIVLLLAIPAMSILADFSAAGFQSGIARAKGFATVFLGWGRLWFALFLLSLASFAVFKIYGRYSLPKPFRPRIRVIRTTIRLSFLAVLLVSVATFLSYFSGVALNLYNNPMVRVLIDLLRQMFGF